MVDHILLLFTPALSLLQLTVLLKITGVNKNNLPGSTFLPQTIVFHSVKKLSMLFNISYKVFKFLRSQKQEVSMLVIILFEIFLEYKKKKNLSQILIEQNRTYL